MINLFKSWPWIPGSQLSPQSLCLRNGPSQLDILIGNISFQFSHLMFSLCTQSDQLLVLFFGFSKFIS